MKSGLYIVSLPIGNSQDITLRALDVLKQVDLVLCEDTRTAALLFSEYGIKRKLESYHDHNADQVRPAVLEKLKGGMAIALVSDAGTPLISDPGYKLVRDAREHGIYVTALPGACAAIDGLVLSGLPTDRFFFQGFLPSKSSARRKALDGLRAIPGTLVFYESPHRIAESLRDIKDVLGDRDIVLARELTKKYEEVLGGKVDELLVRCEEEPLKGEIVVLVEAAAPAEEFDEEQISSELSELLKTMSVKGAVQELVAKTGWPKNRVYRLAMQVSGKK